jgi:putative Mg2+ transporter-C (MgtC) family protein
MDSWNWLVVWVYVARMGAAALLGGALGLEREWKGHWAGLRTHMMVSIGAALFVIAGLTIAKDHAVDTTRVIQGVAAGIGFLGAGTILKLGGRQEIMGLTTAASIWLAAALGVAAGLGEFSLAVAAALVSLFVLGVLQPVEKFLERRLASFKMDGQGRDDDCDVPE